MDHGKDDAMTLALLVVAVIVTGIAGGLVLSFLEDDR